MKFLLLFILVLGVSGLMFSGYLSYRELWSVHGGGTCVPLGERGTALGAPPCIYGFFMYLAITVLAAFALVRRRAPR